jgi:hypothetical protein
MLAEWRFFLGREGERGSLMARPAGGALIVPVMAVVVMARVLAGALAAAGRLERGDGGGEGLGLLAGGALLEELVEHGSQEGDREDEVVRGRWPEDRAEGTLLQHLREMGL